MALLSNRWFAGLIVLSLLFSALPATYHPAVAESRAQTTPVASHPRLWLTAEDLPHLQSWATDSNPYWQEGLLVAAEQRRAFMDDGSVPGEDTGSRYWELFPTEMYAELFAFVSLIHPDETERADYAQRARTLLMYVMNEAVKGVDEEASPYRDPAFVAPHSDRARWWGEAFALTVDWIYPILSTEDKATIRQVFLRWCEEIVNEGYHHPEIGLLNDPALLSDPSALRWSSNNYFTSHLRNIGLMALALDPEDDPGGELGAYLETVIGAHLYMADHLMRTDAAGGLAPEGFEYSPQQVAYVAEFLLALHTSGQDDPEKWGPQVVLTNNPFWEQVIPAYLHSLSPQTTLVPGMEYMGPVYQPAWYGDGANYWGPDFIGVLGALGRYDELTGNTERLDAIRWIEMNLPPGGVEAMIPERIAAAETFREAILYFMLFDPTAPAPTDPRPALPLTHFATGMGRLLSRTGWSVDATWFTYSLGWVAIDHQFPDGNGFSFYRDGEWLTKGLVGYGSENTDDDPTNDYSFALSENNNTLSLENDPPYYSSPVDYYYLQWKTGSQWEYSPAGDPTIIAMSVTPGYAYALGDATNLYNSTYETPMDILHASRSIIWLAPDVIIVYDRAASKTENRFKRFWLNFPTEATVDGNRTTMTTDKGQQLVVTTLLPSEVTPVVEPLAMSYDVLAIGEPMRYRLLVEAPGNPTEARFLNVLQGADAGATTDPVTGIESTDGTFAGTVVGSTAVLFPVDLGGVVGDLQYTVPDTTTTHLITGLTPGDGYDVTTNTVTGGIEVTLTPGTGYVADEGGVILVGELTAVLGDSSIAFTNALTAPVAAAPDDSTTTEPAEIATEEAVTPEPTTDDEDQTVIIDLNGGSSPEAGSAETDVTTETPTEGGAAASGEGQIVFEATDLLTGNRHIYRIDATEGAKPEDVTLALDSLGSPAPDEWIGISPDGEWLLLGTERFDPSCAGWPCLAVVPADLSTGETVKIGGEAIHPEGFAGIGPGGDQIVYPASGGPHSLDLWLITRQDDGWSQPLLLTAESPFDFNHNMVFSADGTHILFDCGDVPYGEEGTAICEAGTDGSDFRVVVTPEDAPTGYTRGGALHHADYAPDGGIVFQTRWSGSIWVIAADSSVPAPLGPAFDNDGAPCVLADGRVASLWLGRDGNDQGLNELKVMTADGAEYVLLVNGMAIEDIGCGG